MQEHRHGFMIQTRRPRCIDPQATFSRISRTGTTRTGGIVIALRGPDARVWDSRPRLPAVQCRIAPLLTTRGTGARRSPRRAIPISVSDLLVLLRETLPEFLGSLAAAVVTTAAAATYRAARRARPRRPEPTSAGSSDRETDGP